MNEEVSDLDVANFLEASMDLKNTSEVLDTRKNSILSCTLCNRKFARKDALIEHTATLHSTDKPFSCEICYTSLATKRQLKRHKRAHTEAKEERVVIKTLVKRYVIFLQ